MKGCRGIGAAAVIVGFGLLYAGDAVLADEVLMRGVPSQQQWIDVLKPKAPLTRGIRPGEGPEQARPPTAASVRVLFAFNSAELTDEAKAQLDQLGFALASDQLSQFKFMVEGHTDATGTPDYNQSLSERRARAVFDYLVARHGINPKRLVTVGRGEADLYDPAHPDSEVNRRVRIVNLGG